MIPIIYRLGTAFVLAMVAAAPSAAAADHVCPRVADGAVVADGLLDDWRGFRPRRAGSGGANRSFDLRCAYDARRLYVALDVRDDRVIRTGRGDRRREDSVLVRLRVPGARATSIRVFPGTRGFKPRITGARRGVEVGDSLQPNGFSVEVAIPLAGLAGWGRTVPALAADLRFADVDAARRGVEGGARFRGRLHFSGAAAVFSAFLQATGLGRGSLRLDTVADVDLGRGPERVVAGGSIVGVISDSFVYMQLPVASPADVLAVKVVNFDGRGRSQILAHYRQRGNGSREVVAVWNVGDGDRFEKLLAVEVKKELGANALSTRWSLEKAGTLRPARRGTRGVDLVLEAEDAIGFTASSYNEMRATDAKPILLPWSEAPTMVYWFDGDELGGSAPIPERLRARRQRARR